MIRRVSALIVLLSCCALGQVAPQCLERDVFVSVLDQFGRPVRGLSAAAFRAKLGKDDVTIESAEVYSGQQRIIVLLDSSGSMRSANRWATAESIAYTIAASASDGVSLGFLRFADRVLDRVDFGADAKPKVLERIKQYRAGQVTPSGGTALAGSEYDAGAVVPSGRTAITASLREALSMLQPPQPGDELVLISDGIENVEDSDKTEDLKSLLLKKSVRLVVLRLYEREPYAPPSERFARMRFSGLAAASGGIYIPIPVSSKADKNPDAMSAASNAVLAPLYRLRLRLSAQLTRPTSWKLSVVTDQRRKKSDLVLLYPSELSPCSTGLTSGP
jgi:hypothetical protein